MPHDQHHGLPGGAPSEPTALVVDATATARPSCDASGSKVARPASWWWPAGARSSAARSPRPPAPSRALAKPVDPRLFVDVMRGLTPSGAAPPVRTEPVDAVSVATGTDTAEMFLSALPHRLSRIAGSAQAGDAAGVALAAETLAVASGRLGHAEVALLSNSIARDARRGTVSHGRLVALVELCARLDPAPCQAVHSA